MLKFYTNKSKLNIYNINFYKENKMILNPTKTNYKLCINCHNQSVLSQGILDRCYKCGNTYSKRGVLIEDMETLDNLILKTHNNNNNSFFNKILFILTA